MNPARQPSTQQQITTINPATGEKLKDYAVMSEAEVGECVQCSVEARNAWRNRSISERASLIGRLAQSIRAVCEPAAKLISTEMGKPIAQASAEVEKCAYGCEFYAEHGPGFLADDVIATSATKSYVRYDPLGCVLAVMPWNFPFWQVFRFVAPTLIAGNVGLLKHASNVTGCALMIEEIVRDAGIPDGVFQTLVIPSERIEQLIADPAISAVTLTGSDRAGRAVAQAAGKHLKKTVLELGGSDPFIVLEDADLDAVMSGAIAGRTLNSGQSCIAAKRFLVAGSVYDEFVTRLTTAMSELPVGDPFDPQTKIGPLARQDLVDELHEQVRKSVSEGARLTTGGQPLDRPGCFYPPTVLADVTSEMTCFNEETFGPVASVTRVKDAEEAILLANVSEFGLGGSIWSRNVEKAQQLAGRIETGGVFINTFTKSDPHVPFGGVKHSGYGRELGVQGIREFVNTKTIWIE